MDKESIHRCYNDVRDYLAKAAGGDMDACRRCETVATEALDAALELADPDDAQISSLCCLLQNFRGKNRVVHYGLDGNMAFLEEGVNDLRVAVERAATHERLPYREPFEEDLSLALVRYGEQCRNAGVLKEACRLLEEILHEDREGRICMDRYQLVNAYGVAQLRLGTTTGDRGLVEKACDYLSGYLKTSGLGEKAKSQTLRNLVVALSENARQNRNQRVYRDLLNVLDKHLAGDKSHQAYFLRCRAKACLELSDLVEDIDLVREAVRDIGRVLDSPGEKESLRIETLHIAAQAHFRLAKRLGSAGHASKAVDYVNSAIALLGQDEDKVDDRRPPLLADRASYFYVLARLKASKEDLVLVERDYREALNDVVPESAPWLYAKIGIHFFSFLFDQGKCQEALDVFRALESAWEVAIADPDLGSEIHAQRAEEMVGHYIRAARCHLELGQVKEAVMTADRGRATKIVTTSGNRAESMANVHPGLGEKIARAARQWEQVRKGTDEKQCRDAWRHYLDLRREAGLDLGSYGLTGEDIVSRIPPDGAIVQIFGIDNWCRVIIVKQDLPEFVEVTLPDDVAEALARLLHDDKGSAGWGSSYHDFRSGYGEADDERERFTRWSHAVDRCLDVLGRVLFEPLHRELLRLDINLGSTIVLSPPGELALLPLAGARLGDGSQFNERWSVSMMPNLSLLSEFSSGQKMFESDESLVISDPEGSEDEGLPLAAREAALVKSMLPEAGRKHLQDDEATVVGVVEALPGASIVHVACHGIYEREQPEASGIELAGGKRLTISRLKSTPESIMRARLVFLSCCEAGIAGQSSVPDEFVGVLPSFLQCGAQATIGALWAVYDDATMLISSRFYQEFLDDKGYERCPPATALARAQAWLRNVTLGELVDQGLLGASEGKVLADARFARIRLRIKGHGKKPAVDDDVLEKESPTKLTPELRDMQPYSSPVDWAAFVVLGI